MDDPRSPFLTALDEDRDEPPMAPLTGWWLQPHPEPEEGDQ